MLNERLQVLIATDQRQRLEREAAQRGTSVATLVREAIDKVFPATTDAKRRAAQALLESPDGWVPDDPADLRHVLDDAHDRWV